MTKELSSEKKRVDRLVNKAQQASTVASELAMDMDSESVTAEDVLEDIIQAKIDVEGSMEDLTTLEESFRRYCNKEMKHESEQTKSKYVTKLMKYAEKKGVPKIQKKLEYLDKVLKEVIEGHKEGEEMSPKSSEVQKEVNVVDKEKYDKMEKIVKELSKKVKEMERKECSSKNKKSMKKEKEETSESEEVSSESSEISDDSEDDDSDYCQESTRKRKYGNGKKFQRMKMMDPEKFDGTDKLKYDRWRVMFMEGYGKNPDLSNKLKLVQMANCLAGRAKKLVEGLPITKENYNMALKMLDRTYITNAKPLYDLEIAFDKMKIDQKNYVQMETDMATITGMVMSMKNRGVNIDMPATILRIVDKFPQEIREELYTKVYSGKFDDTYETFERKVDKIITAKLLIQKFEKYDSMKDCDVNVTKVEKEEPQKKLGEWRRESFQDRKEIQYSGRSCMFHEGYEDDRHLFWNCPKMPSERSQMLSIKGLCYMCFKGDHAAKWCQNERYRCHKCNGNHNTALHETEQEEGSTKFGDSGNMKRSNGGSNGEKGKSR